MKINIKQEGGFIGMASKAKLDFNELTEKEQKMLNAIAEKAAEKATEEVTEEITEKVTKKSSNASTNTSAEPTTRSMSPARDVFNYCLSMKKDGKKVDVAFDDTNAPPELVQLFQKYIKV